LFAVVSAYLHCDLQPVDRSGACFHSPRLWRFLSSFIILKGGPKLERHREAFGKFVGRHTPFNYRSGYIMALVTLFLLTSVLPMLASFKISYDREMAALRRPGPNQSCQKPGG